MQLNVKDIPDSLFNRFKAACILENQTMREIVIKHMQEYVHEKLSNFNSFSKTTGDK